MLAVRRTAVLVAVVLTAAVAAPSVLGHDSLYDRKDQLDSGLKALRGQIEAAKEKEGVLSSEIEAADSTIDSLESEIGSLSDRLATLESELAAHRARLDQLEERYLEQTRILERLIREHAVAQRQLEERLVELYETDQADALEILLRVESLNALIEQVDYMTQIGLQDRRIVAELDRLRDEMRVARRETAKAKDEVERATAVLADKVAEERAARAALIAEQNALAAAQAEQRQLLAGVREDRHEAEEDLEAMAAASAQLSAQIQAAQSSSSSGGGSSGGSSGGGGGGGSGGGSSSSSSSSDSTPSSSGLIWPVSGPVTSGYGWRWGRMHYGIDISASYGTPVRAAASGSVIYAGAMSGYGNIVVIDHGGSLATAYAHLSSIYVGGGSVSQGQSIGAVGCTGSCTGNHLHFEVRVNGSPVDPFGYL